MSDALFGVDGTELPPLAPDPSGRGRWRDSSVLPALPLPPIPDLDTTRDAIAAALDEDPSGPVDEDPATMATVALPSVAPPAAAPASPAQAPASPAPTVEALPPSAPRPTITAISPAQPPRGGSGPRYRAVTGSFPRVHLRDPRRRLGRLGRGLPSQSRSNGGAGAFFVIMLIVFAVLLYFIITGIVESFARLIP